MKDVLLDTRVERKLRNCAVVLRRYYSFVFANFEPRERENEIREPTKGFS